VTKPAREPLRLEESPIEHDWLRVPPHLKRGSSLGSFNRDIAAMAIFLWSMLSASHIFTLLPLEPQNYDFCALNMHLSKLPISLVAV